MQLMPRHKGKVEAGVKYGQNNAVTRVRPLRTPLPAAVFNGGGWLKPRPSFKIFALLAAKSPPFLIRILNFKNSRALFSKCYTKMS